MLRHNLFERKKWLPHKQRKKFNNKIPSQESIKRSFQIFPTMLSMSETSNIKFQKGKARGHP
jgi:hypothetical protein